MTCDENGFAESKLLPYGIYTVKQVKGWEGKELLPAFDVYINEDGYVHRFLINNATFESLIEIVKKDAETEKVIPVSYTHLMSDVDCNGECEICPCVDMCENAEVIGYD